MWSVDHVQNCGSEGITKRACVDGGDRRCDTRPAASLVTHSYSPSAHCCGTVSQLTYPFFCWQAFWFLPVCSEMIQVKTSLHMVPTNAYHIRTCIVTHVLVSPGGKCRVTGYDCSNLTIQVEILFVNQFRFRDSVMKPKRKVWKHGYCI